MNWWYLKFDFNFITWNNPSTWSVWLNKNDSSSQQWSTVITTWYWTGNRARVLWFSYNKFFTWWRNNDYIINQEAPSWQRFNFIFTFDWTTWKVYYNWTLIWSKSMSYNIDSNNISWLFTQLIPLWDNTQYYRWYASKVIIENKAWSDSECLEYVEKTKKKYGLS